MKPSEAPDQTFSARYSGRAVVAIGAHPDDLELAVGGMLARLSRCGAHVVMAVVSVPGDYETRLAEAKAAAEILGCELRVLMDTPGRVDDLKTYQLVGMIDRVVREFQPAAVLTHSASEFHRDHVTVHHATLASQRLRQFDFFSYSPTMCRPVPVDFHPRIYVDVTSTIDRKMAAIRAHESQFHCRGIQTDFYRDIARMHGWMVGVEYAEGLDVGRMLLA
jgi:N-acetylglucosamine malate deacetylase 1